MVCAKTPHFLSCLRWQRPGLVLGLYVCSPGQKILRDDYTKLFETISPAVLSMVRGSQGVLLPVKAHSQLRWSFDQSSVLVISNPYTVNPKNTICLLQRVPRLNMPDELSSTCKCTQSLAAAVPWSFFSRSKGPKLQEELILSAEHMSFTSNLHAACMLCLQ